MELMNFTECVIGRRRCDGAKKGSDARWLNAARQRMLSVTAPCHVADLTPELTIWLSLLHALVFSHELTK
jgi:hypothetical protein